MIKSNIYTRARATSKDQAEEFKLSQIARQEYGKGIASLAVTLTPDVLLQLTNGTAI